MKKITLSLALCLFVTTFAHADPWRDDPVWHDGLAEKAVYDATRIVYGQVRQYEAVFFTNKEQHDKKSLTKADRSDNTVEVFKHNQIELIPTPNYDYSYVTTSHLTVETLELTRIDASSQEWCGTSFKQYLRGGENAGWEYRAFSYMPEAGWIADTVEPGDRRVIAADSLPLVLRDYDFDARQTWRISLLPGQKSNRHTPHEPVDAAVRYAGEEDDAHRLELVIDDEVAGTYWMARDRLHVMLRYDGADGQTYRLRELSRVDYWTREE